MKRIISILIGLAVVACGAVLAFESHASAPTPGIGAVMWNSSDSRTTVTPGSSKTFWVAFHSTGPRETAKVTTQVSGPTKPNAAFARTATGYFSLSSTSLTLPAKPANPVTLTGIPNGIGGTETLTTPNAYVFVKVTVTVPADAPAYTFTSGDAYENIVGQVQLQPAAGITISPGAGVSVALSTK